MNILGGLGCDREIGYPGDYHSTGQFGGRGIAERREDVPRGHRPVFSYCGSLYAAQLRQVHLHHFSYRNATFDAGLTLSDDRR